MVKGWRYSLQILNYLIWITLIGYFSSGLEYHLLEPNQAVITLALTHSGQLKGECRKRTAEELAKLPPNMRAPLECPRGRSPIEVRIVADDLVLFEKTLLPAGLSGDGRVDVYKQFKVPSGSHQLLMQLKDSVKVQDFNYVREEKVTLVPGQIQFIEFNANAGGFVLK